MQITPLSYCSVAPCLPWLEAPPSFTVSIGANSIMDNAIEEAVLWKRVMLHMHIFGIEPLACHGSKQPSSLTPLANRASTIVDNAVVQMLSLTPNHWPLPKRRRPNAVA